MPTTDNLTAGASAPVKSNMDILVSVAAVLPDDVHRAEAFIQETLTVLAAHFNYHELLLIDNGSQLAVYFAVQKLQSIVPNVRLVRLSRRYSSEVALAAALDHSIGDYVVIMDPSIHPPALIPRLVARGMEGCDSVAAIPASDNASFLERIVTRRVYSLASRILGFQLRSEESYYRLFSRRLVNSIVRIRSKNRYLSCLNASIGLHQDTISYTPDASLVKKSALRRVLRQVFSVSDILVSNSGAPLRFASTLGMFAIVGNLFYLIYILVVSLLKDHLAEGWLTTSLTNTTMFLTMFFMLTILSEYIARILDETKDQPLYFVESETNSVVSSTDEDRLNVVDEAAPRSKAKAAMGD